MSNSPKTSDGKSLVYKVGELDLDMNDETFLDEILEENTQLLQGRHVQLVSIATQPRGRDRAALIRITPKFEQPTDLRVRGVGLTLDNDMLGLTTIVEPKGDHELDILAMSGLNGNAYGSFKAHGREDMWLIDTLAKELPQARISLYGYNSNFTDPNSHLDLPGMGHTLQVEMEYRFEVNGKPILCIAHSMGGLVLEQCLLRRSVSSPMLGPDLVHGIIFFGVPVRGMDVEALLKLEKLSGDTRAFIHNLEISSSRLRDDFQRFLTTCQDRKFEVYCFTENIGTSTVEESKEGDVRVGGPKKWLVRPESADIASALGHPKNIRGLDRNHSDLVKYRRRGDPELGRVVHQISLIVDNILAPQTLNEYPSNKRNASHPIAQEAHTKSSTPKLLEWEHTPVDESSQTVITARPNPNLSVPGHPSTILGFKDCYIPPLVFHMIDTWLNACSTDISTSGAANDARLLYGRNKFDTQRLLALYTKVCSELIRVHLPVVVFKSTEGSGFAHILQDIWHQCIQGDPLRSMPKNVIELLDVFKSAFQSQDIPEGKCLNIILYIGRIGRDTEDRERAVSVYAEILKGLRDLGKVRILLLTESLYPALTHHFKDQEKAALVSENATWSLSRLSIRNAVE